MEPDWTEYDVIMRFLDGTYTDSLIAVADTGDTDGEIFAFAVHHVNEEWEQGAQVVAILVSDPRAAFGPVRKLKPKPPHIIFLQGGPTE